MRYQLLLWLATLFPIFAGAAPLTPEWPQFRGPGGSAVSEAASPPVAFGPSTNLLWKTSVPLGYSSPIIAGNRIFLTGGNEGRLETLAIDLHDGKVLWRRPATDEKIFPNNDSSRAASTPVTDGTFVYVFFGAVGVITYDLEGTEQWRKPLAKPDVAITSSPILIDDKLIILCDVTAGSYIEALDKKTGRSIWRTDRSRMSQSFSTPFHWLNDKRDEIIVAGSYWLTSYDPRTGKENWRYSGVPKVATSTPVAARELLFSASTPPGNEPATGNENPALGDALSSITDIGQIISAQTPKSENALPKPENALVAIRSCGSGEVNGTHLAWKNTRSLPGASSPIFYAGRLFTVKAGGFVSAYHVQDGRTIYQDERLNAPGDYYASAVAAEGRIYFVSDKGVVTVIDAKADSLTVIAQNKLGEQTLATPALAGVAIVMRTEQNLYAFAKAN